MKYLMLGAITEAGQQLDPAGLEAWMAEIGAWYEKYGSSGKLADPGFQLDRPDQAKTIRANGVFDGLYMESKEVLGCGGRVHLAQRLDVPGGHEPGRPGGR